MTNDYKLMACTGKRSFGSRAEASQAASKSAHRKGIKMNGYKCESCGKYHIGSLVGVPRR